MEEEVLNSVGMGCWSRGESVGEVTYSEVL